MLEMGLYVAICTDNPGISRTDSANEYLAASRMTESGLSQWETLSLIRQSLVHSFLPAEEKDALLKKIDTAIFDILIE